MGRETAMTTSGHAMRPTLRAALFFAALLVAAMLLGAMLSRSIPLPRAYGQDDQGANEGENSRIRQGFAIAPVPLNLEGKNRALVGLGSYIVNAQAGCNDCHSCPSYAPGHNPFFHQPKQFNAANYLAGGVPFGPFTSRNITPGLTTGLPADFTFEQFEVVLRTGKDFDLAHPGISDLLQVMPWPVFQSMLDRDLRAIYEYLSAIPHAKPGTCSGAGQ
jgi:hypothetical protein